MRQKVYIYITVYIYIFIYIYIYIHMLAITPYKAIAPVCAPVCVHISIHAQRCNYVECLHMHTFTAYSYHSEQIAIIYSHRIFLCGVNILPIILTVRRGGGGETIILTVHRGGGGETIILTVRRGGGGRDHHTNSPQGGGRGGERPSY